MALDLYTLPPGYDRWRLASPPEPPLVGYCLECGSDVYKGQECYKLPDGYVHLDCFKEYAEAVLDAEIVYAGVRD